MESITFDNAPNGYPISTDRIKFETDLVKNDKSPKLIQELPLEDFSQKGIVSYAKHHKMAVVKGPESWFLFDRRQISEPQVRAAISSGEYGKLLGYSDDTIPDEGTQVALSIDGEFTDDPHEILNMRDNNKLGLSWKAQSVEDAKQLSRHHMGHGDCEA